MFTIKGFMANESLVANAPGLIAQFGEISTQGLTYSREKGFYSHSGSDNVKFISFLSINELGGQAEVPSNVVEHLIEVGDYLYTRFNNGTITNNIPALVNDILDTFNVGDITIENVLINELVSDINQANKRLPDYLSWEMTDAINPSITYALKVWFSDEYFRVQYDEYEIIAIPPLANVDDFYQNNSAVGIALSQVTPRTIIDKAEEEAGNHPYTNLVPMSVQWREHSDFGIATRMVDWYFVQYGVAANSPDAMNQAIRDYLSDPANTNLDITDWQEMFPGVFETSEYFLVPFWDKTVTGIPTPVYSPVMKSGRALSVCKLNVAFTSTDVWWNQYLSLTTFIYQAIGSGVIGAPTNTANNDFDFAIKYPDYLNIPLTHTDAGKMSPTTQGFVTFINRMIQYAETVSLSTPQSSFDPGYSRVTRNAKVYMTGVYEGTRYFVISKLSYTAS